jgi:hypothetical protein
MGEVMKFMAGLKKDRNLQSDITAITRVTTTKVARPVARPIARPGLAWLLVAVALCSCMDLAPLKVIPDRQQMDFQIVQSGCGFAQLGQALQCIICINQAFKKL